MSKFAVNHWYAAAWTGEIGEAPFARRILGEPVVFFRQADRRIAALVDRCAHRLVPLSMGVCVEGRIRCGYHGMEYDGSGKCVRIPAQEIIPPKAKTRSFPVIERYGLVWLWMGEIPIMPIPPSCPRWRGMARPAGTSSTAVISTIRRTI